MFWPIACMGTGRYCHVGFELTENSDEPNSSYRKSTVFEKECF